MLTATSSRGREIGAEHVTTAPERVTGWHLGGAGYATTRDNVAGFYADIFVG